MGDVRAYRRKECLPWPGPCPGVLTGVSLGGPAWEGPPVRPYRPGKYGLVPDRSCFSRIINACAKASDLQKALEYLEAMKRGGIQPDVVTYSCILDACAHAGELDQAKLVFQQLRASGSKLNAVPYACLGRILG